MDSKLLGQRIRQARERVGLSQEQFADLIHKDQRAVSEYENGKRRIVVNDIPTFAEILQVPILYFFDGSMTPSDLGYALLQEFERLPDDKSKRAALEIMRIISQNFSS